MPSADDFEAIVAACDAVGCHLFVDEMYRGLEHGGASRRLPAAADAYQRGVSLCGVSKALGLPGLRIGWVCSRDAAVMRRVAELKDYTSICPPAPSEALADIALTTGYTPILAASRATVASGLDATRAFAAAHAEVGLEWEEPSGGTFSYVRLRGLGSSGASAYSDALRARARLMLVSSRLFKEDEDDRVRVTFGRAGTPERLKRWAADLHTHGLRI